LWIISVTLANNGRQSGFVSLLRIRWGTMNSQNTVARIIRVFVSSPSDVAEERNVLDEVVARINRTDGQVRKVRLELWKWEKDTVPHIGPKPQTVIDEQTPPHYDIYLGIIKHRFGNATGHYGSGTEKEFQDALKRWGKVGIPWMLFYFGKEAVDPDELDLDQYAMVRKFRKKLETTGLYATYEGVRGSKDSFFEKIDEHLRKVLQLLVPLTVGRTSVLPVDPTRYLRDLLAKTSYIDIRGLQIGQKRAHRVPIEDLYISLTTTAPEAYTEKILKTSHEKQPRAIFVNLVDEKTLPLDAALQNNHLVVIGDPGAGKTTFLRRVAYALCQMGLGDLPEVVETSLGISKPMFPIMVKLSELDEYITRSKNDQNAPAGDVSADWLPAYLAASGDKGWGLDENFFRKRLEGGSCMVLLDGLDEARDRIARARLSRLIENVGRSYPGCQLIVTSRPAGYEGEACLPDFAHAEIDPLSDQAVETFLSRWCEALFRESPTTAADHCSELLGALHKRPEIRKIAQNPVMVTAIAVLHWNERRLPEQRADLYESIIRWLSRSREQRPGREKAENTLVLLQELALAMQSNPEGIRTEVSRRWAAEKIAPELASGKLDKDSISRAESFLDAEEIDSGIVVGRGNGVQFWHRTFQEYMAARAIAARPDSDQQSLLWGTPIKAYRPEWQEVMLLLASILHQQGRAKVDNLVRSMIKTSTSETDAFASLLAVMLRDLEPVGYRPPDRECDGWMQQVIELFEHAESQAVPSLTLIAAAEALSRASDNRLDFRRADYWVGLEATEFMLGSQSTDHEGANYDPEAPDDETVRKALLDSFLIARFPVTVELYRKFLDSGGYRQKKWWQAGGFGEFSKPKKWEEQSQYLSRPVVGVSWYESAAFCRWASCRLPTEAEWERAARGLVGRRYPWGHEDANPSRLNSRESGINELTPVGLYSRGATPDGIFDMAGNILEWCADLHGAYSTEPLGLVPKEIRSRVYRGGCWFDFANSCRAAYRRGCEPEDRRGVLGFRMAKDSRA